MEKWALRTTTASDKWKGKGTENVASTENEGFICGASVKLILHLDLK